LKLAFHKFTIFYLLPQICGRTKNLTITVSTGLPQTARRKAAKECSRKEMTFLKRGSAMAQFTSQELNARLSVCLITQKSGKFKTYLCGG